MSQSQVLAEALNPRVFELLAVHAVVPVLVVGGSCQNELLKLVPTMPQVWSLTQFYSVDFLQSGIGVKSAFSINAQSSLHKLLTVSWDLHT